MNVPEALAMFNRANAFVNDESTKEIIWKKS